jgi:hypothetical protein
MNIIAFFFKILEKLTFNRLNSFVQNYNITDAQHGFNGSRSTETACHFFI